MARSSCSGAADGLGLGLAICRQIVNAHGGRLWAAHNGGHGAAFRVTLLKRMNASGLFLPMVLITADDESGRCQRLLDEGAVSWLRKPLDGPQLIQRLEHAVLLARSVHAMNARVTAFAAR